MAIVRKKGVADVTKRGVADVTKKGVANVRMAYVPTPSVYAAIVFFCVHTLRRQKYLPRTNPLQVHRCKRSKACLFETFDPIL